MKTKAKAPKKFSWKITTEPRDVPGKIALQEQCSSGSGSCCGKCGNG